MNQFAESYLSHREATEAINKYFKQGWYVHTMAGEGTAGRNSYIVVYRDEATEDSGEHEIWLQQDSVPPPQQPPPQQLPPQQKSALPPRPPTT